MIHVPLQLRRRAPEPTDALLLTSMSVAHLLDLCAAVGTTPLPGLYAVADGFLLRLTAPVTRRYPRTIALRALAPHLLLPVDADLVPALFPDEAAALVKQRGLVFLPGGRVLSYAFESPLSLAALVSVPRRESSEWAAFPEPPVLAERLLEITLDLPQPPPEEILSAGAADMGTEPLLPPAHGGALATLRGNVEMVLGQGLVKLGAILRLQKMAEIGAQFIRRAVERVPQLSESVLGRQEAALRELLRLFREGKLEQALRRALPMGGADDRGGVAAQDANLPLHSLLYSLGGLLGAAGGAASIWFGGGSVQADLAAEYRKAAEAAARRGDYRRAAFIYGKLLADYRAAANVLYQGGLYRDAAILYLKRLDDRPAAARAFDAAGEFDEALRLYRQLGAHVEAGDLLKRLGEDEAALQEYRTAANALAFVREDWIAAGDLMLNKAARPDLAENFWSLCWERRPCDNDVACALRLGTLYEAGANGAKLLTLTEQGRAYFTPRGNEVSAGRFFNEIARLARSPKLAAVADDLRDHALIALAAKVRERADVSRQPGDIVSNLLGQSPVWTPGIVSDAQYAVKEAVKGAVASAPPPTPAIAGRGVVTAVVSAAESGELFIAFENGELVCFSPRNGATHMMRDTQAQYPIRSLATNAQGDLVVAARSDRAQIVSYSRLGPNSFRTDGRIEPTMVPWLSPTLIMAQGQWVFAYLERDGLNVRSLPNLYLLNVHELTGSEDLKVLLVAGFQAILFLWWDGADTFYRRAHQREDMPISLSWSPGNLRNTPGQPIPLAWFQWDSRLELAGVTEDGNLHWSHLAFDSDCLTETATATAALDGGYVAAAIVKPGMVAGVTGSVINWLRTSERRFLLVASTALSRGAPVIGAFMSRSTNELLVLRSDGTIERVVAPGA